MSISVCQRFFLRCRAVICTRAGSRRIESCVFVLTVMYFGIGWRMFMDFRASLGYNELVPATTDDKESGVSDPYRQSARLRPCQMKNWTWRCLLVSASIFVTAAVSWSAAPTLDEIVKARHWASAKFLGVQQGLPSGAGLNVLANLGEVQLNARAGKPLKIGETQYTHGLYCHAISSVLVHLPGPAKTFEATVGVDHNESTSGGRGSVVFSVMVAGKQAFQSSVMHGGEPGVPVNLDLNGATSLTLNVGDAGDGEPCDQSDWADARVTLLDGRTIWLGDLPISHAAPDDVSAEPPFSFTYSGKPFCELVKGWKVEQTSEELDAVRTRHTITYAEPSVGLVVRCVAVEYSDFPTLEWTVYFKNTGSADTGILENIQALDTSFQRGPEGEFVLHHQKGTPAEATDYRPFATELTPNLGKQFNGAEGRPSGGDLPYFNLEWKGQGAIVAVGWPGQWSASFKHDQAGSMAVTAGQELTHLKLRPGEEIRTPLMVLQFWNGDPVRAQNVWRRWMMAHNMPKPGGCLQLPSVRGDDQRERGKPEALHRSLPGRGSEDRLLVDGRRLVYEQRNLVEHRNLGGRQKALPERASCCERPRQGEGHEDYRVVRARESVGRNMALG
jgi:hypothetical protein